MDILTDAARCVSAIAGLYSLLCGIPIIVIGAGALVSLSERRY